MCEQIIVSIQHALDDEKLRTFLLRVANDHFKLPIPLEDGYTKIDQSNVWGVIFDPTNKSLTVRHRRLGRLWDSTSDVAVFTAFFSSTEETPKKSTKAWGGGLTVATDSVPQ